MPRPQDNYHTNLPKTQHKNCLSRWLRTNLNPEHIKESFPVLPGVKKKKRTLFSFLCCSIEEDIDDCSVSYIENIGYDVANWLRDFDDGGQPSPTKVVDSNWKEDFAFDLQESSPDANSTYPEVASSGSFTHLMAHGIGIIDEDIDEMKGRTKEIFHKARRIEKKVEEEANNDAKSASDAKQPATDLLALINDIGSLQDRAKKYFLDVYGKDQVKVKEDISTMRDVDSALSTDSTDKPNGRHYVQTPNEISSRPTTAEEHVENHTVFHNEPTSDSPLQRGVSGMKCDFSNIGISDLSNHRRGQPSNTTENYRNLDSYDSMTHSSQTKKPTTLEENIYNLHKYLSEPAGATSTAGIFAHRPIVQPRQNNASAVEYTERKERCVDEGTRDTSSSTRLQINTNATNVKARVLPKNLLDTPSANNTQSTVKMNDKTTRLSSGNEAMTHRVQSDESDYNVFRNEDHTRTCAGALTNLLNKDHGTLECSIKSDSRCGLKGIPKSHRKKKKKASSNQECCTSENMNSRAQIQNCMEKKTDSVTEKELSTSCMDGEGKFHVGKTAYPYKRTDASNVDDLEKVLPYLTEIKKRTKRFFDRKQKGKPHSNKDAVVGTASECVDMQKLVFDEDTRRKSDPGIARKRSQCDVPEKPNQQWTQQKDEERDNATKQTLSHVQSDTLTNAFSSGNTQENQIEDNILNLDIDSAEEQPDLDTESEGTDSSPSEGVGTCDNATGGDFAEEKSQLIEAYWEHHLCQRNNNKPMTLLQELQEGNVKHKIIEKVLGLDETTVEYEEDVDDLMRNTVPAEVMKNIMDRQQRSKKKKNIRRAIKRIFSRTKNEDLNVDSSDSSSDEEFYCMNYPSIMASVQNTSSHNNAQLTQTSADGTKYCHNTEMNDRVGSKRTNTGRYHQNTIRTNESDLYCALAKQGTWLYRNINANNHNRRDDAQSIVSVRDMVHELLYPGAKYSRRKRKYMAGKPTFWKDLKLRFLSVFKKK